MKLFFTFSSRLNSSMFRSSISAHPALLVLVIELIRCLAQLPLVPALAWFLVAALGPVAVPVAGVAHVRVDEIPRVQTEAFLGAFDPR